MIHLPPIDQHNSLHSTTTSTSTTNATFDKRKRGSWWNPDTDKSTEIQKIKELVRHSNAPGTFYKVLWKKSLFI